MKTMEQLLSKGFYLTDGGMETTLVFHEGVELNYFAAFELLSDAEGRARLERYYSQYLEMARKYNSNFILETPTWRANYDWGYKLGYSENELRQINIDSVDFLKELKNEYETESGHILLSGCIGPRGDGYVTGNIMSVDEAADYHNPQINALATAGVDLVSAFTINYSDEAVGIARAAKKEQIPAVISFTLETDGLLPNGESLEEAIEKTDRLSNNYVTYYMINCAHPEHFLKQLNSDGKWKNRIAAIRANASTKSHAELDESEHLDSGDCHKLAESYDELKTLLPELRVAGGCCGTDITHIQTIADRLIDKTSLKIRYNMLFILIMLIFSFFTGIAQSSEVKNSISAGSGISKIARQDLIFSPFIHSATSILNGRIHYTRDGKLFQQASLKFAIYSPMHGEQWQYTENGELKTAGNHLFTFVDTGYSAGKKIPLKNNLKLTTGGSVNTAIQVLNYVYSRIGNFGYLSTLNLSIFGKIDYSINPKNNISFTVELPLVNWLARSPFLVNDDEFIKNTSSHSAVKSLMSFLKDGQLTSWESLQSVELNVKYICEFHRHWGIGLEWFYKYLHSAFPRNLVSKQNSINLLAILKF